MPGTELEIRDVDWFKFHRVTADLYTAESIYWTTAVLFWAAHPTATDSDKRLKEAFDSIKHHQQNAEQTRQIEDEEAAEELANFDAIHEQEIDERVWNLFETAAPEFQPTISVEQASLQLADVMFRLEEQGFRINIVVADDEMDAYLSLSFPELKYHDRIIQRNGHGEWEDYPA